MGLPCFSAHGTEYFCKDQMNEILSSSMQHQENTEPYFEKASGSMPLAEKPEK